MSCYITLRYDVSDVMVRYVTLRHISVSCRFVLRYVTLHHTFVCCHVWSFFAILLYINSSCLMVGYDYSI